MNLEYNYPKLSFRLTDCKLVFLGLMGCKEHLMNEICGHIRHGDSIQLHKVRGARCRATGLYGLSVQNIAPIEMMGKEVKTYLGESTAVGKSESLSIADSWGDGEGGALCTNRSHSI